ncbi:MAG: hypothetical protein ACJAUP_002111 [Cellvibrionaceae bacterium]|jgi:hypothetical protein
MNSRDQLISSLVGDLTIKKHSFPVIWVAILWWLLSWVYVVTATFLMGPIRLLHQYEGVLHAHQFQIESLIGLVASLFISIIAWYGSTPGALSRRYVYLAFTFVAVWLAFYVVGFFEPALEPSMVGKRDHCYLEAFIYSLPPTVVACFYIVRRYPINKIQTGFLVGLAGGIIPALFMQFSCMYESEHIFTYHIVPAIFAGVIGVVVLYIFNFINEK